MEVDIQTGLFSRLGEGAVAIVAEEAIGVKAGDLTVVPPSQVQIEPAVAVVIQPERTSEPQRIDVDQS